MKQQMNFKMKLGIVFLLGIFSLSAYSCDDDDGGVASEQSVNLELPTTSLELGQEVTIIPKFDPDVTPTRTYSWENGNPEAVSLAMNEDYSAVVTGLSIGNSSLVFSSTDGELEASVNVSVGGDVVDDGVLKVLAIGNSFSEDAVENYLHELVSEAGIPMVIGNLYIGGASLDLHWENAQNDAPAYSYRKINLGGVKTSTASTTIATALNDENWDYISFQQVSGQSGQFESFEGPLPQLVNYVKENNNTSETSYILHQTWAYSSTSTHGDFPNYNSDQEVMYNAIVDAVRRAQIMADLDYVIPAGTAIQNARNTFLGESFTRDGYHLSLNLGRYTAASTWFEALTGNNVIGYNFAPEGLSEVEVEIAQHAAHAAVQNPDELTPLTDYQDGGASPLTSPVLVNFGHRTVPTWNSLTDHHEGAGIANLKDVEDGFTGIALQVTKRFNAMNQEGVGEVNTTFDIPSDVSTQSYYGNTRGVWQNLEIRESEFKLSGLDTETSYDLCFFSSRANVGDNRETQITVIGDNSAVLTTNSSSNSTETVCSDGIRPDHNGEITVHVTAGDNNNNGSGFYYLNAMRVSPGE